MVVQGTCGDTFQPRVNGGEAGWTVICGGGMVRANGWVKDTKADGKGAEVCGGRGDGAGFGTVRAGGSGSLARFDKPHAGSVVNLWLRVIQHQPTTGSHRDPPRGRRDPPGPRAPGRNPAIRIQWA